MVTVEFKANIGLDCEMDAAKSVPLSSGLAVCYSQRCPDKLTANEDAFAVLPLDEHSGVLAVADGVGGFRAGDLAARTALDALRDAVDRAREGEYSLRMAILDGIESANQRILKLGIGAATTLAVLEVQGREIRPYHVGDAMVLVVGGKGKIKWQTVSHSPVGFAVEAGILDEDEALHHEDRHLVSNVVGSGEMRIEIGSPLKMAPRDTVLLSSDGLFDNLTIDEISERVRKGPLGKAVERLMDDAVQRMTHPLHGFPSKPDDTTMVAFRRNTGRRRRKPASPSPIAPPEPASTASVLGDLPDSTLPVRSGGDPVVTSDPGSDMPPQTAAAPPVSVER